MEIIEHEKFLSITCSKSERAEIAAMEDVISDDAAHDYLEATLATSEFEWVYPYEAKQVFGDLTDAPMLGTRDEEGNLLTRYAFMTYETRSILEDLRDFGRAVFIR